MRNYGRILTAFKNTIWVIDPDKAESILAVLELRASGDKLTKEQIEARVGARAQRQAAGKAVAVIPVLGTISQRMGLLEESSGGASAETIARQFRAVVNDPEVGGIVLDVDSPGGSVYGIPELSDEIYAARGKKPIYAVANAQAASGAYWLATSADKLFVTPSGEVGSVGVVIVHEDVSAALEQEGVKVSVITSGEHKWETNGYQPLSDDARGFLQKRSDEYYEMFVGALARNRSIKKREVQANFGQGRTFGAKEAVDRGMADGVKTIDQVIAMLVK